METKDIVNYLDQYLRVREIRDASLNGLQVEGTATTEKIGFAVDACLETFRAAAKANVDLLIVHHGLFWGKVLPVTGSHHARLKSLLSAKMNLYCAHLPLDAHPEVGNNAQIAKALNLDIEYYFGDYGGTPIAVYGRAKKRLTAEAFHQDVKNLLGEHVRLDAYGPKYFRKIGICSGAGASLIPEAHSLGIEAFITGEPRHSFFHYTKEERLHAFYGRHYDTETIGLQALSAHLTELFELPTEFFHAPSEI